MLPVFQADGRWYVAGRVGNEYEVRIRNDTGGDLLAVVSVDGVNVVSGETASTSQSGYVIGPWQSLSVQGWRKSLARVAAFYFTDLGNAYATRTGRPDDVGAIGVAVFRRKAQPPAELEPPQLLKEAPSDGRLRRQGPAADPPARSEAPLSSQNADGGVAADSAVRPTPSVPVEQSIGTGHGRSQTSHARYVSFERESEVPNESSSCSTTRAQTWWRAGSFAPYHASRTRSLPASFPTRLLGDEPCAVAPRGYAPRVYSRGDGSEAVGRGVDVALQRWRCCRIRRALCASPRRCVPLSPAPMSEPAAAEELFQDIWMNLVQARTRYRVEAKFTTYLYTLAHNRLMDHFRRGEGPGGGVDRSGK